MAVDMGNPNISALMIYYDRGDVESRRYFSDAVQSILDQTYKNIEIVLVVSGERSFARKLALRSKKIRLFFQKESSFRGRTLAQRVHDLNSARNICLKRARGAYICWLDADDISLPDRMQRQLAYLQMHPEIGLVGSSMILVDGDNNTIGMRLAPETDAQIRRKFMQFNPIPQSTVMAYRKLLLDVGGYCLDEIAEDFELWVRLAKVTKFHNMKEPVIRYRVHKIAASTEYKLQLYLSSFRTKMRAVRTLSMFPGPSDLAVNAFQLISLLFPEGIRRTVLERLRSRFVIGNK